MAKTYEKLDIYTFGRQLIETRDLDPVYVLLHEVEWPHIKLCNYLMAYFCFYHMGTAAWITDATEFHGHDSYWIRMKQAAASKDYPRSSERRHFRGQAAIDAVNALDGVPPKLIISRLTEAGNDLQSVMNKAKQLRNFGPWIAFKMADITERLGLLPIEFQPSDVFAMFKAPREGAAMMAEVELGTKALGSEENCCTWAYTMLRRKLGTLKAPPRYERRINIQEIETILCKWKSHMNGHYFVGKDIQEIRHGLSIERLECNLTDDLIDAGVRTKLWSK